MFSVSNPAERSQNSTPVVSFLSEFSIQSLCISDRAVKIHLFHGILDAYKKYLFYNGSIFCMI